MFDFDPTEAAPARPRGAIVPAGVYAAQVISAENKVSDDGNSKLVDVVFEILDGEYKGARCFWSFFTHHHNEAAQRIGREDLAALCLAAAPGVAVRDMTPLMFKPLNLTVKVIPEGFVEKRKGKADYLHTTAKNKVGGVEALKATGQRQAPRPMAQPAPQQSQAPSYQTNGQHAPAAPSGAPTRPWDMPRQG